MHKAESKKFHETADELWEMAKRARAEGFLELEDVLQELANILHARGSGQRSKLDTVI
jgi:hypothetical protein